MLLKKFLFLTFLSLCSLFSCSELSYDSDASRPVKRRRVLELEEGLDLNAASDTGVSQAIFHGNDFFSDDDEEEETSDYLESQQAFEEAAALPSEGYNTPERVGIEYFTSPDVTGFLDSISPLSTTSSTAPTNGTGAYSSTAPLSPVYSSQGYESEHSQSTLYTDYSSLPGSVISEYDRRMVHSGPQIQLSTIDYREV